MKTALFLLFVLSLNIAQTQTYTPFFSADSSDMWKDKSICNFGGGPACLDLIRSVYSLSGDTVINGTNWVKLYKKGELTYTSTGGAIGNCPPPSLYPNSLIGAVQEVNKQVFFMPINGTPYLMYDFNLTLGDTVPDPSNSGFTDVVVVGFDSVFIAGFYRKVHRVSVNSTLNYDIIEGVGSSLGLFSPSGLSVDCASGLECYSESGVPVYSPENCDFNLAIDKIASEDFSFQVSPNPVVAQQSVFVEQKKELGEFDVRLMNTVGQILYEGKSFQSRLELKAPVVSGIYMIQIDGKASRLLRVE